MRLKPVPEPRSPETIETARAALPLVPAAEEPCTIRLMDALGVERDEAGRWLTFLQALEAVVAGPRGYRRTRSTLDRRKLIESMHERVFGVEELLSYLANQDAPVATRAAFEAFSPSVPPWERRRDRSWQQTWRAGVERRLGWLVAFGLAEEANDGYRVTPDGVRLTRRA